MRLFLTTLLMMTVMAPGAGFNSKPDLSGTWNCMESPKQSGYAGDKLVIAQNGPEIKMSHRLSIDGQTNTLELVFFADGRGDENPSAVRLPRDDKHENSSISVTVWRGSKLSTKYSVGTRYREFSGATTIATIDTIDNWELSKDGTKLTRVRTVWIKTIGAQPTRPFNPSGRFLSETKYVYVRQS